MQEILRNHRGKVIGAVVGFIFGLLTVVLGFWKTFFVTLCIAIGYFIGKRMDDNDDFKKWVNKIIRGQ